MLDDLNKIVNLYHNPFYVRMVRQCYELYHNEKLICQCNSLYDMYVIIYLENYLLHSKIHYKTTFINKHKPKDFIYGNTILVAYTDLCYRIERYFVRLIGISKLKKDAKDTDTSLNSNTIINTIININIDKKYKQFKNIINRTNIEKFFV